MCNLISVGKTVYESGFCFTCVIRENAYVFLPPPNMVEYSNIKPSCIRIF